MQFWEMRDRDQRTLAWVDQEALEQLKAEHGDMAPRLRALRVPGVAMPVRLAGSIVRDFVWTWYSQCLIQDRVLQMFREQGFTGFELHPVSAKWKRRSARRTDAGTAAVVPDIPTLWELIPIGWGGTAPEESGMRLIEVRPSDGRRTYSKYTDPSKLIDERQWDGSDFFILWPLTGHIFCSDRVAQFIKSEGFSGVKLTRVQDMVWPGGIGDACSPAPLRYDLPESQAREIGEPLGIY
jgi:hypothetical protein